MLSRFSLTFFLLFFSNKVLGAEEKGGMPQLNPESFSSQIFWLFVTFSILFLVIHFFLLPKLRKIREKREETVSNYLSQTQKLPQIEIKTPVLTHSPFYTSRNNKLLPHVHDECTFPRSLTFQIFGVNMS